MDAAIGIVDDQAPLVRALIGLTVVTGLVDTISFLGLGHIFTSNMTGNVVFLGFSAGGAPGISAARSIAALCAFAGGSVCGGRLISSRERAPIAHLLITTYVEMALLLTAAGAAAFAAGDASLTAAYAIVLSTAVAIGLRNAVVRKVAVPDLTTTVLTMTIRRLCWRNAPSDLRSLPTLGVAALMVAALSFLLRSHARPKLATETGRMLCEAPSLRWYLAISDRECAPMRSSAHPIDSSSRSDQSSQSVAR
jgi:hypothetical protein